MTSDPSIDSIRIQALFSAIDQGKFETLSDFFAPRIVYERPGYQALRGLEAVLHFYRHVRIVKSGRHKLARVVVGPDAAACWGRFTGTSRDGQVLDERFADVYELTEGLIVHRTTYFFRGAI